jgi:NAD(P)-dependent dehydrogenase (short-subunit alcohol dehydrogenase family)
MVPLVYLISGSGRGLGKCLSFRLRGTLCQHRHISTGLALVQTLANRENVLVFAGVRKPSPGLESVAARYPEKVKIVTLLSGDTANNEMVVAEIKRLAGRLDIVIANAALGVVTGSAFATSPRSMADHYDVNVIGPLVLFQTTYPLLKASTPSPKFIPISSSLGSIEVGATSGTDWFAYGVSKSALNYLAKKLRHDHDGLSESLGHLVPV